MSVEINTEINKIFGAEMAKVFASTITDEELRRMAEQSWWGLNKSIGYTNRSKIDDEMEAALLERVRGEINTILETEDAQGAIKEMAQRIVQRIRERAEEKLVESVSDRVAGLYLDYQGKGLNTLVSAVIQDAMKR